MQVTRIPGSTAKASANSGLQSLVQPQIFTGLPQPLWTSSGITSIRRKSKHRQPEIKVSVASFTITVRPSLFPTATSPVLSKPTPPTQSGSFPLREIYLASTHIALDLPVSDLDATILTAGRSFEEELRWLSPTSLVRIPTMHLLSACLMFGQEHQCRP
jgi:hypothetical protein